MTKSTKLYDHVSENNRYIILSDQKNVFSFENLRYKDMITDFL